ncbi:hypothetical protein SDC9_83605 [bioreactor metagenome]|uniref:Uncharacterized protein n=1 Tax=bioreactor metagenome TaxID=1076179 RepID=A0A644ZAT7_9ZZZZ
MIASIITPHIDLSSPAEPGENPAASPEASSSPEASPSLAASSSSAIPPAALPDESPESTPAAALPPETSELAEDVFDPLPEPPATGCPLEEPFAVTPAEAPFEPDSVALLAAGLATALGAPGNLIKNSLSVGGRHEPLSQTIHSTYPFTTTESD